MSDAHLTIYRAVKLNSVIQYGGSIVRIAAHANVWMSIKTGVSHAARPQLPNYQYEEAPKTTGTYFVGLD